ncbi:MAG: zinc ribbon domain-containing protein [Deltaproteobacteria bacterium]|nr:zinc ribbon domain-containing protein [Deltaproteobacteria bacterium]MBI2348809.1 zinc ribbon domain-containing protein [Deltaproteobacteria bacterium]
MPIYEYKCRRCGDFEVTQRITEKPLSRCPTCKGKVKKLISNTSFQLKGTGWYITDYARKDKTPKEKSRKTEAKSDGKAGSTSDGGEKSSPEKSTAKSAASESTAP